jgi:hypothetical protein
MQRFVAAIFFLVCGLVLVSLDHASPKDRRIQFAPHFVQGATLRYLIETNTSSNEHMTTPIIDSEAGTQFKRETSFLVRLDVLAVRPAGLDAAGVAIRLRATFEKSHADSSTDASAPDQGSLDDEIDKLAGHSFEFTLAANSQPSDVKGLDEITTNRAAAQAALAWVPVLANVGGFPRDGVELGQKWTAEHAVFDLPLAGMTWRSESSYVRNEPCESGPVVKNAAAGAAQTQQQNQGQQMCAVILNHFSISRHGSEHADATPEDYRRQGLRTSGKWTLVGESLNSVSLNDGFLVSSTQTATQDMDYEIASASSGSRIHQVAHTKTQTEINLIRDSAASSR